MALNVIYAALGMQTLVGQRQGALIGTRAFVSRRRGHLRLEAERIIRHNHQRLREGREDVGAVEGGVEQEPVRGGVI